MQLETAYFLRPDRGGWSRKWNRLSSTVKMMKNGAEIGFLMSSASCSFSSSTVTGRISRAVCVRFSVTSKVCRVYVSGLFCSSGGLSDIKGDVHLGDVAHIRRYGRRTNNNKLRKRLCRRIHERRPIVDNAGSSAFLTPLFFSSHPFTMFCPRLILSCDRMDLRTTPRDAIVV